MPTTPDSPSPPTDRLYSISEVAEAFGLTVAALRFYEDRGLIRHSERRGRVRHYSREDLARLAYAQLWHEDGMLTLAETSAIVESERVGDRLELIAAQRDAMIDRIEKMRGAVAVLDHMLGCRTDRALDCPMTGDYIRGRVAATLDGTPHSTDFWPESAGRSAPALTALSPGSPPRPAAAGDAGA